MESSSQPRVICLLNGITDEPLADLGGLTPLQKACHLTLDALAQEGACSRIIPPSKGGFTTSLLSRLGVTEFLEDIASGPLEAMGLGFFLTPRQRAFSCRLISTGGGVVVDAGDQLVSQHECALFCRALNRSLSPRGFHFVPLRGPLTVLITSSSKLEGGEELVPSSVIGQELETLMPRSSHGFLRSVSNVLAGLELNALRAELEEPPVNGIWLSGGGGAPTWKPNAINHSCALYTQSLTSAGVAKALGLSLWRIPQGPRYSELALLLKGMEAHLARVATVILDLNYLWESTYSGELLEKIKRIEWLDAHFLRSLVALCKRLGSELILSTLRHVDIRHGRVAAGPVPCVRWPAKSGHLPRFDESAFAAMPL